MGRRRTLLLITSILLAAVGTALIGIYVKGADARAEKGQDLVRVQVVTREIPAGTSGSAARTTGSLVTKTRRQSDVEGPVITDLSSISNQLATYNLLPGQVLQPGMFSASPNSTAEAVGITSGHVGAAFQLTDPQRVAGTLQPGMSVSVFEIPAKGEVKQIISPVRVIKVGNDASVTAATSSTSNSSASTSANSDDVARTIITFDLTPNQMTLMLTAQRDGTLALGLLPTGSGS